MLNKIGKTLGALGRAATGRRISRGFRASYLARICQPKTVFDVGVGYGTPELYKAFPAAKFFLLEPLVDYRAALEKIARNYDCQILYSAVGDEARTEEIMVDSRDLHKSSFQHRSNLTKTGNQLEGRQVDITTLDTILEQHPDIESPLLLKIDTEGHELEVVEGAEEFLKKTDIVIAEVSVARRFENSYSFEEFVRAMSAKGFAVYDFLRLRYVKDGPGTRIADVVFKKRH